MIRAFYAILVCTVFFATTAHAGRPAGDLMNKAIALDITATGFDQLSAAVPSVIPEDLELGDVTQTGSFSGIPYEIVASDLDVGLEVTSSKLSPADGYIRVTGEAIARVNSPSNLAKLKLNTTIIPGFPFTVVDCDFWVKPVNITLDSRIVMVIKPDADGNPALDAILEKAWTWTFQGSDIQVENCLAGDIDDVLSQAGISVFDFVKGPLENAVNEQIDAAFVDLETTLEESFSALRIDQTFAIGEGELSLLIEPNDVVITTNGMRINLKGQAQADLADCVSAADLAESPITNGGAASIGTAPAGVGPFGAAVLADDDFVNQVLLAAARSGAICIELSGETGDLPINTGVLNLLSDRFQEIAPETKPMWIGIRPAETLVASTSGSSDLNLSAPSLMMDMFAEIDGRKANVLGLNLNLEAGADLNFDGQTGILSVATDLTADDIRAKVAMNEFIPGAEPEIEANVGGLFESLAGPLLGDILSGLEFAIPSFGEIGVQSLELETGGTSGEWIGAYANLGEVPYGSGGCDDAGGCSDGGEGCEGGCSSAGGRGLTLLLFPLTVAFLRRRRV